MDVNEVTLSQWQAVFVWAREDGHTDLPAGSGKGPNHPVHSVSGYACVKCCNALSEQAGLQVEWGWKPSRGRAIQSEHKWRTFERPVTRVKWIVFGAHP